MIVPLEVFIPECTFATAGSFAVLLLLLAPLFFFTGLVLCAASNVVSLFTSPANCVITGWGFGLFGPAAPPAFVDAVREGGRRTLEEEVVLPLPLPPSPAPLMDELDDVAGSPPAIALPARGALYRYVRAAPPRTSVDEGGCSYSCSEGH